MKQGDLEPSYRAFLSILSDGVLSAFDLTDHTVKFVMVDSSSNSVKVNADAIIEDPPTAGIVRYDWASGDTDTIGDYKVVIKVDPDTDDQRTFPTKGYDYLTIEKNLG